MSLAAPPLRFLVVIVGGWICFRAAVLVPSLWPAEERALPIAKAPPQKGNAELSPVLARTELAAPLIAASTVRPPSMRLNMAGNADLAPLLSFGMRTPPPPLKEAAGGNEPAGIAAFADGAVFSVAAASPALVTAAGPNRWSASAWLFVRRDGEEALAPGGTLGGSQFGARLLYRVNSDPERPLALSARFYSPLDNMTAAEGALGIDWRPIAAVPVHILAERREKLGDEGRSAFALSLYGGIDRQRLAHGLRLDGYAQAGVVGLESRDLFADGALRFSAPLGSAEIGAGAWGAAQPGAARLDIGPQASLRLPVGGTHLRLSADWRFRIAGDAEPGSGPALAIATDF